MKAKLEIHLITGEGPTQWRVKFLPLIPVNYQNPEPQPKICLSRYKYANQNRGCWFELEHLNNHSCPPVFENLVELQAYVNRVVQDFDVAVGKLDAFHIGDTVKVKDSVINPTYGWGGLDKNKAQHGKVEDLFSYKMTVSFPCQLWNGRYKEFEKVEG